MIGFARYLVILGFVIFGFIRPEAKLAEGSSALWMGAATFFLYFWIIRAADGVQNTCRNVARIFLLRTQGLRYNHADAIAIQEMITPTSSGIVGLAYIFLTPLLAGLLVLLIGSWWTLGLIVGNAIIGPWTTPPYRSNLERIAKRFQRHPWILANFKLAGYPADDLREVVEEAISFKRDPQRMWADEVEAAQERAQQGDQEDFPTRAVPPPLPSTDETPPA